MERELVATSESMKAAWYDEWAEKARRKRMLASAGAKLTKPKLVATWQQWRNDWQDETHAKASMSVTELLEYEKKQRKEAESLYQQTAKALADARQAMSEGRGSVVGAFPLEM